MRNVELSALSARLAFTALFSWNTPALFVTVLIATPLLQLGFFVLLGTSLDYGNPLYYTVGLSLQGATAASIGGLVGVIAEERGFGTLGVILVSPASRLAVFVGRMAPGVVFAVMVAGLTAAVGFVLAGWGADLVQVLLFAAAILIAALSGSALGLALSAFGLVYRDIFQVAMIAQFVLLLCTGASIQSADLPAWVRLIAEGLPLTHAIAAGRLIVQGGDSTGVPILALFAAELAVAVVWTGVALVLMVALERAARAGARVDLA
jgi:ABC-2 type transport system permease protein